MKSMRVLLGLCVLCSAMVVGCRQAPRKCCCYPAYTCYPCNEACGVPAEPVSEIPEIKKEETEQTSERVHELPAPVQEQSFTVEPVIEQTRALNRDTHQTKERPVQRRTFADITAHPCFDHAGDYSWLIGELQFIQTSNTWRLRYSSIDKDDRYGGSVTLIETGPMTDFHSGQMVRVEGQMIDPSSTAEFPRYRVRSIVAHPLHFVAGGSQF